MRCDDMQEHISPYLDGELGLTTSLEVERHLQDCRICSQDYENHRALRAALRAATGTSTGTWRARTEAIGSTCSAAKAVASST